MFIKCIFTSVYREIIAVCIIVTFVVYFHEALFSRALLFCMVTTSHR